MPRKVDRREAKIETGRRSGWNRGLIARGAAGVDAADERLSKNAAPHAQHGEVLAGNSVLFAGAHIHAADVEAPAVGVPPSVGSCMMKSPAGTVRFQTG